MSNDVTLLVARILLAVLFLVSGLGMLAAPGGFAGYMGSIGMPAPMVVTWLVIALKVVGGIALVAGFQTRYVAYALAAFCVATAFIGHFNLADQNQMTAFMKNLGLTGGFLLLSVTGAGALSVDARGGRLATA
jgi:putative oxidoreductase